MSSTAERPAAAWRPVLAGALLALAVGGCASTERFKEADVKPDVMAAYLQGKPEPLHPHYATLLRQGTRNAVLNHMRTGLAAAELGATAVAAESFDQALAGIEAVYANTETAEQARSVWNAEAYKDFKGEPYERAMAYYYRGLLYMRQGDYENARASFKGGLLQDAFAAEEQNRADFALLTFLEGWASRCAGSESLAAESFAETRRLRPEFVEPAPDHNVLLLAETGTAPVKYGDGPQNSLLRFRRGDGFDEARVRFEVGGQTLSGFALEDVYQQAATRGGRPVDHILAGKVSFKETAATTGTVLKTVGVATMLAGAGTRSGEAAIAGAALTIFGLIADGMANAARPEADARYWDNLPDGVLFATLGLPPEPAPVQVHFLDGSDRLLESLSKPAEVTFAGKCGLAWVRARSALPAAPAAPGTTAVTGQ
jgi:tetratricopeptide (TPR) repeat protein